jgi:hypothetical protein
MGPSGRQPSSTRRRRMPNRPGAAAVAGEGGRSLSITSTRAAGSPARHGPAAGPGATIVHRADAVGPLPSSTAASGLLDDATAVSPQRPGR